MPFVGPDEILIKVVIAASNPKGMLHGSSKKYDYLTKSNNLFDIDYKHLYALNKSVNSGDDVAGYVSEIGDNTRKTNEFRIGDRVAGLHKMLSPGGAYAEYAVVPAHTAFLIPDNISFEG